MGKSPNPTEDGKCKCCNCENILEDEAVLRFTKNTWGSGMQNIVQPTSFKMSPTSTLDLKL